MDRTVELGSFGNSLTVWTEDFKAGIIFLCWLKTEQTKTFGSCQGSKMALKWNFNLLVLGDSFLS